MTVGVTCHVEDGGPEQTEDNLQDKEESLANILLHNIQL